MTSTDTYIDLIDTYAEAGFLPVDECPVWLASRYDAAIRTSDGWLVASGTDDIHLSLLTRSGVIRTEARFDPSELGRAAFTAAALVLVKF